MDGCEKDLHSGVFGGSVHEAMTDLITLMGKCRSPCIPSLKLSPKCASDTTFNPFGSPTGSLVDRRGRILIPGMYEDVAPLTDDETQLYEKIDFDLEEYCKDVGVRKLLHSTKASRGRRQKVKRVHGAEVEPFSFFVLQEQILMHRWRYPSLSLHGIEGAFADTGAKTVIPRKVNGKFSIRLVPDMDPKVVEKKVRSN